jgi:hypothetical protein
MIKLTKILQEIGDASAKPYPFQLIRSRAGLLVYGFESEHFPYTVTLELSRYAPVVKGGDDADKEMTVVFFVNQTHVKNGDKIVTNKGELYRVMATVTSIINQELKERPEIDTLIFNPSKRKGNDTARESLYLRYIKQTYPNAEIDTADEEGILVKFK